MATLWKLPPRIKIYEALGAVADGRVAVTEYTAKVSSSGGNKQYDVSFDPATNILSCNDNGSYWQGYVGYPAIAFLMTQKILPYDEKLADALKGIAWKEINTKFKNDWNKTEEWIYEETGYNEELEMYAQGILQILETKQFQRPEKRKKPPRT